MKDFFYDFFISPFADGDIFVGVCAWFVSLFIILLLAFGSIYVLDRLPPETKTGAGIVIEKKIREAYSATTYALSGNILIPITAFFPEKWELKILIDGLESWVSVSEDFYESTKIKQMINCEYISGRVTKTLIINECKK